MTREIDVPPEVGEIKKMAKIAAVLFALFGIMEITAGLGMEMLDFDLAAWGYGAYADYIIYFALIIGIVMLLLAYLCLTIIKLVDAGKYEKAKTRTLVLMIVGLIFGMIPGIVLIIAYVNYKYLIADSAPDFFPEVPNHLK